MNTLWVGAGRLAFSDSSSGTQALQAPRQRDVPEGYVREPGLQQLGQHLGAYDVVVVAVAGLGPAGCLDPPVARIWPGAPSVTTNLGFGLYWTGRPNQKATVIELRRLERFLRGYRSIRPLTHEAIEAFRSTPGLGVSEG